MNILFAANEAHPLYKLGGLGDVASSLPKSLAQLPSIDVRIILPHHLEIKVNSTPLTFFSVTYKHKKEQVFISQTFLPGTKIPVYLVANDTYLSTSTNASDNHADKYAFFSLAVSSWLVNHSPNWQPNIIHLNDWHTAFIPLILTHLFASSHYKTLLTIHNIAYQANTYTPIDQHLHLPPDSCDILNWDKEDMNINFLLEGILHSSAVNTVSPTYAQEILTSSFSFGLDPILTRTRHIKGILNGIDIEDFNPQTDPALFQRFSIKDAMSGKLSNKLSLFKQLNFQPPSEGKLISFIGRIDSRQKGIEYITDAIKMQLLPPPPHSFIFLGVGELETQNTLHQVSQDNPHIRIITRFDEALSRQIYAASDLIIIPSQYEPCGLVQMIAMRYGSLPIVHNVGGLKDTVEHGQNGFVFDQLNTSNLFTSIIDALQSISDTTLQSTMINLAMSKDFSWNHSAQKYLQLYQHILED